MPTYLVPVEGLDFSDVVFEFDCDLSESWELAFKWTEYAIESGQSVSDYAVEQPFTGDISGVVTAWFADTDDEVYTRVQDTLDALEAFARTRQPLTVISGLRTVDVVIEKVSSKRDQGIGEAAEVTIKVRTYQIAEYEEIEIPATLLAPEVEAGATPDPGGTEAGAATEEPEEQPKTYAATVYDFLAGQ